MCTLTANISDVCCLIHVPGSGSIMFAFLYANIVNIYGLGYMPMSG